jgi:hypothetical protein
MARNITLTLGAGLGADLGPNFNLTANVGSVTPSTATKSELTAGKSVSVDDAATQVTVTSTGTCTNSITQTIPCGGTTTTTTEATTTTTTAAPSNCITYTYTDYPINIPNDLEVRYRSCASGNIVTEAMNTLLSIDNNDGTYTYTICVDQSSSYSTPVCVQGGIEVTCPQSWVMGGSCGSGAGTTTTTTAAPTTTTTTAGAGSFTVKNTSGSGQVDDVTTTGGAYFYFFNTGNFPLTSGQQADGGGASLTGADVFVDISNFTSAGCLSLYINSVLSESIAITASGTYTFTNKTFTTSDVVLIEYISGACP